MPARGLTQSIIVAARGEPQALARRAAHVPPAVRTLAAEFQERRLLTWATALSYNALWAVPPLALLLLALAGFFNLNAAWKDQLGPSVEKRVTPETWTAINSTVDRIIGSPHLVWLVIGTVLATWHVSGIVRSAAGALNSIYREEEHRSTWERSWQSVGAALPVLGLTALTALVVVGGRLVHWHGAAGAALFAGRWLAAAICMWALLAVIIRVAPTARPHARWVSVGAGLAVGGWIAATIVFGLYVSYIADFKSPYGNLVSVMVIMAYVYWLSIMFLVGVLTDAVVARRTGRS